MHLDDELIRHEMVRIEQGLRQARYLDSRVLRTHVNCSTGAMRLIVDTLADARVVSRVVGRRAYARPIGGGLVGVDVPVPVGDAPGNDPVERVASPCAPGPRPVAPAERVAVGCGLAVAAFVPLLVVLGGLWWFFGA